MARARALAAGLVALLLCAPHPDALGLVALPLGYGHLLGPLLASRGRVAAPGGRPGRRLRRALGLLLVVDLFALYLRVLHAPGLRAAALGALLVVSAWHIAENDLAMGPAARRGFRLGPLPRAPGRHALALGFALAVALVGLTTAEGARLAQLHFGNRSGAAGGLGALAGHLGGVGAPVQPSLRLETLLAAIVLYHGIAWILFSEARARALPPPARRALRVRLAWIHALPLAANAALYLALPAVHAWATSPALYLFWSVLHAFQTARARGLAARGEARPRPAPA